MSTKHCQALPSICQALPSIPDWYAIVWSWLALVLVSSRRRLAIDYAPERDLVPEGRKPATVCLRGGIFWGSICLAHSSSLWRQSPAEGVYKSPAAPSVSAWRAAGDMPHAVSSRFVGQARAAPRRSPSPAGGWQQIPCGLFPCQAAQGGSPRPTYGWSAAAPLFRLHLRQVSLTLSWTWPAELSNRSTLNCWVSFGW